MVIVFTCRCRAAPAFESAIQHLLNLLPAYTQKTVFTVSLTLVDRLIPCAEGADFVAPLAFAKEDKFIRPRVKRIAILRQVQWFVRCVSGAVFLHAFRKLADVIDVIPYLGVVRIQIAAGQSVLVALSIG